MGKQKLTDYTVSASQGLQAGHRDGVLFDWEVTLFMICKSEPLASWNWTLLVGLQILLGRSKHQSDSIQISCKRVLLAASSRPSLHSCTLVKVTLKPTELMEIHGS